MPSVAVAPPSKPSVLPMATTRSPTLRSSDEPNSTGVRSSRSTWITARSSERAAPSTVALAVAPSANSTSTVEASPTTCAFVAIRPSAEMTKPVPVPRPSDVTASMRTTLGRTVSTRPEMSGAVVTTGSSSDTDSGVGGCDGDDRIGCRGTARNCATHRPAGDGGEREGNCGASAEPSPGRRCRLGRLSAGRWRRPHRRLPHRRRPHREVRGGRALARRTR